jgi:hypothetical protein
MRSTNKQQRSLATINGFERYTEKDTTIGISGGNGTSCPLASSVRANRPHYPDPGNARPVGVERMLRIYFLQQGRSDFDWSILSSFSMKCWQIWLNVLGFPGNGCIWLMVLRSFDDRLLGTRRISSDRCLSQGRWRLCVRHLSRPLVSCSNEVPMSFRPRA